MSKQTIKGFLQWTKNSWESTGNLELNRHEYRSSEHADHVTIRQIEIEVDVPDDFDPTPGLITGLEEQKRKLRLKLAAELADLDDRISKLQALPMSEAA